jgi:transposase
MEQFNNTTSERVDDLPVIIHWLSQMQIQLSIDEELPKAHGNRQGLSCGQLAVLLLTYILTQADHRLCAVESWVRQHHQTLEIATGWKIRDKDCSDDRLADMVSMLGDAESDAAINIETALGQHLVLAYDLPTDTARCDTTSLSVHHQMVKDKQLTESDTAPPLLAHGHSKDHRPDLLQYRQMLGTIDPVGIPLVSATLTGNGADDPIYFPTWQRLVEIIGHTSFLYIADCKASSWANRAKIDRDGGIYCFPLAMTGNRTSILRDWVLNPPTPVENIFLPTQVLVEIPICEGFEVPLGSIWLDSDTKKWHCWSERWFAIRSMTLAKRQIHGLEQRMNSCEITLAKLAEKPGNDIKALQIKIDICLRRYRVSEYLTVKIKQKITYKKVYNSPGRPGINRPYRRVRQIDLQLEYQRRESEIQEAYTLAGWRLFVSNASTMRLSLEQTVLYYKEQWQPEMGFHRFKRGQLPALPIYFQDETRIRGLMFLLSIALRVFTLVEFVVRRHLSVHHEDLAGLYDGNPKRKTTRPTAERLLAAFNGITMYFLRDGTYEISPLNCLQKQILNLMGIPQSLYTIPQLVPT